MSIYYVKRNGTEIFDGRFLVSPKLHLELNAAGYLEFDTTDGQAANLEDVMNDTYAVYEGTSLIFTGRPTEITTKYNNKKHYYVEGAYGYLNDTLVAPFVYQSKISFDEDGGATMDAQDMLEYIVEQHNSQVPDNRKIQVLKSNAKSVHGNVYRKFNFDKSIEALSSLRDELGGFMYITYSQSAYGTTPLLLWVSDIVTTVATQTVELGKNILDLSRKVVGTDIPSAIVPIGPTISSTDSVDEVDDLHILNANTSQQYLVGQNLTLINRTDVNNGKIYITNSLVDAVGLQYEKVEFSSVKSASELLQTAREYMTRKTLETMFIDVNVADLHYAKGYESDNPRISFPSALNVVATVYNPPIQTQLPVSSMDIELDNAVKKITLGTLQRGDLSEKLRRDSSKTTKDISDIKDITDSLKNDVASGSGGSGSGGNISVTVDSLVTPETDEYATEIADVNVTSDGNTTKYQIYQKTSDIPLIYQLKRYEYNIEDDTALAYIASDNTRIYITYIETSPVYFAASRGYKHRQYNCITVPCFFQGKTEDGDIDFSGLGSICVSVEFVPTATGEYVDMKVWVHGIKGNMHNSGSQFDGKFIYGGEWAANPTQSGKSLWHYGMMYQPGVVLVV